MSKIAISTRLLFHDRTGTEIINAVKRIAGDKYVIAKDPRFPELTLVGQASDAASDHLRVTADGERGFQADARYTNLHIGWNGWPKIVFKLAPDDTAKALANLERFAHELEVALEAM
jgi:hypothetical protein